MWILGLPNCKACCLDVTDIARPVLYVQTSSTGNLGGPIYEKVLTRKRGTCGDACRTSDGSGYADQHRLLRRSSIMIGPAPISASMPAAYGMRPIAISFEVERSIPISRQTTVTAYWAFMPARNGSGAPGFSVPKRHLADASRSV